MTQSNMLGQYLLTYLLLGQIATSAGCAPLRRAGSPRSASARAHTMRASKTPWWRAAPWHVSLHPWDRRKKKLRKKLEAGGMTSEAECLAIYGAGARAAVELVPQEVPPPPLQLDGRPDRRRHLQLGGPSSSGL